MLEITRQLARELKTMFTRALGKSRKRQDVPHVLFSAGPDGLSIRAATFEAAIERRLAGEFEPAMFGLPLDALAACEGRRPDPVRIEVGGKGQIVVSWEDHGVLERRTCRSPSLKKLRPFPDRPTVTATNGPTLLRVLKQAAKVVDKNCSRYALDCLQLHGQEGNVAATDGQKLLVHSGFEFPWPDEVLIPTSPVFASPLFAEEQNVLIGRAGNWVAFSLGDWTVWLPINTNGRFPSVQAVLGTSIKTAGQLRIATSDAQFLSQAIGRLPGGDDPDGRVALDLNGRVTLLAQEAGAPQPTELLLANSTYNGAPLQVSLNRAYLAQALEFGFSELRFKDPLSLIRAQDERRSYVFMPIEASEAITTAEGAIRISSAGDQTDQVPGDKNGATSQQPPTPRRRIPMRRTKTPSAGGPEQPASSDAPHNPAAGGGQSGGEEPIAPSVAAQDQSAGATLELAQALEGSLHYALDKTHDLIASLQRQEKHTRLVRTTLASLRALQDVA